MDVGDSLTLSVTVFDMDDQSIEWVTISAFCPICGSGRGTPELRPRLIDGIETWVHGWDNPCGHHDDDRRIRIELATQCSRPGCVVMQSESWAPYCGPECSSLQVWDTLEAIRKSAESLTVPLQELRRLEAVINTDDDNHFLQVLQQSSRKIAEYQAGIAAVSADVAAGFPGFPERRWRAVQR